MKRLTRETVHSNTWAKMRTRPDCTTWFFGATINESKYRMKIHIFLFLVMKHIYYMTTWFIFSDQNKHHDYLSVMNKPTTFRKETRIYILMYCNLCFHFFWGGRDYNYIIKDRLRVITSFCTYTWAISPGTTPSRARSPSILYDAKLANLDETCLLPPCLPIRAPAYVAWFDWNKIRSGPTPLKSGGDD